MKSYILIIILIVMFITFVTLFLQEDRVVKVEKEIYTDHSSQIQRMREEIGR